MEKGTLILEEGEGNGDHEWHGGDEVGLGGRRVHRQREKGYATYYAFVPCLISIFFCLQKLDSPRHAPGTSMPTKSYLMCSHNHTNKHVLAYKHGQKHKSEHAKHTHSAV